MKPESIDLLARSNLSIVLMNAIGDSIPLDSPLFAILSKDGGKLEVEVRLNGIQVPALAALNAAVKCEDDRINAIATTKARELIRKAGLDALLSAVEQADGIVRDALLKVGGELEDDS